MSSWLDKKSPPVVWGFLALFSILAFSCPFVHSEEIILDDYRTGLSPAWKEKTFQGKTTYRTVEENGRPSIKAESHGAASGLYQKIDYDIAQLPILSWSWKIERVLTKGDARTKEGDDFAARVYVVFPSWIFWKTKTIVYIWANKLPVGSAVANPYTANAFMIAVESGNDKAGQWVSEQRNVLEDYRRYFGRNPPRPGAIAIMTDTDNTGDSAVAWYGVIRVSSSP